MSAPTPLSDCETQVYYGYSCGIVAEQAATIAAQATEIAALKGAQRTLDWLDEGWEFPCPSCGGGCYRSRALEKQHCYACGAAFPPEVLRMLAGKEAQGGD